MVVQANLQVNDKVAKVSRDLGEVLQNLIALKDPSTPSSLASIHENTPSRIFTNLHELD